ncbi:MAG: hypothetical protein JSV27_05790 [Candidatus Bathyarchaeota archaeon]|nr:MAG: hypothetical protein JSV27_05790 [Candidatus Bathyarchaeota archaeon]
MTENAVRTACPRDCYDPCSLRVTVEGGKIIRVEGGPEPHHVGGSPGYRRRPLLQLDNGQAEVFTGLAPLRQPDCARTLINHGSSSIGFTFPNTGLDLSTGAAQRVAFSITLSTLVSW